MRAWLFALALRGDVRYVAAYASLRCVHPQSYTARHWRRSLLAQVRRASSYLRVGAGIWNRATPASFERARGLLALAYFALLAIPARRLRVRLSARYRRVAGEQATRAT